MSVSRYIEGLIFSKVSETTFKRIKDNPFRSDINTYKGFEMLYAVLGGKKTFKRTREARMIGVKLDVWAPKIDHKLPTHILEKLKELSGRDFSDF